MPLFKEMVIPTSVIVKVMTKGSKLEKADVHKAIFHLEQKINANAGLELEDGVIVHGRLHLSMPEE
jgi:hypothetical protein